MGLEQSSPTTPCRVELLGAPQGGKEQARYGRCDTHGFTTFTAVTQSSVLFSPFLSTLSAAYALLYLGCRKILLTSAVYCVARRAGTERDAMRGFRCFCARTLDMTRLPSRRVTEAFSNRSESPNVVGIELVNLTSIISRIGVHTNFSATTRLVGSSRCSLTRMSQERFGALSWESLASPIRNGNQEKRTL